MVKKRGNFKILLAQAPPWGVYAPPLGIAYLGTFLKSSGFDVEVYDLNMEIFRSESEEIKEKWDTQDFEFWASGQAVESLKVKLEYLADKILSFEAPVIGFSATFASVPFLNALLPIIRNKKQDKSVILIGGGGASYREGRSLYRKDLVDCFIIGEGEYPLPHLLRDIQNGNSIKTCMDYTAWKDEPGDRAVCLKGADKNGKGLDRIPFPTFEEFDMGAYTQDDLVPLISSRGCVRCCAFCCNEVPVTSVTMGD